MLNTPGSCAVACALRLPGHTLPWWVRLSLDGFVINTLNPLAVDNAILSGTWPPRPQRPPGGGHIRGVVCNKSGREAS